MKYSLSDYDYELPRELIAEAPLPNRTASRLLHLNRTSGAIQHGQFLDLANHLRSGDLLIVNDTKVIPARIFGHKMSGGKVECLLERLLPNDEAWVHLRASKSPKPGSLIQFNPEFIVEVITREHDLFKIANRSQSDLFSLFEKYGAMPLPPYIEREPTAEDLVRYQTVFARHHGAVAAPTAGLHLDQALLAQLKQQGVELGYVTLHVGAGTFQPVRSDDIRQHQLHSERFVISEILCEQIRACRQQGGKIVAVGTTVVRALESLAAQGELKSYEGDTTIFIYPGYTFKVVDALVTNFHLPKSSLLMLVAAFAGYEQTMQAYRQAVTERYRFFSYGDAMFIA